MGQRNMKQVFSDYPAKFYSEIDEHMSSSSLRHTLSSSSSDLSSIINSGSSSASDKYYNVSFATPAFDEIMITEAMCSILSSTSSQPSGSVMVLNQNHEKTCLAFSPYKSAIAFSPYKSAISPTYELKGDSAGGQKMMKNSIAILRNIGLKRNGDGSEELQLSRNQPHHIISERRRREKLNDSFYELKQLLPPSSKKDKVSVLCKTKDYLKRLEAQIYELEKNNKLEEDDEGDGIESMDAVSLRVIEASELEIGLQRVSIKIHVRVQCDLLELVLHALEYLKQSGITSLISLDAHKYYKQMVPCACTIIKFDIKVSDWDEQSLKEGIIRRIIDTTSIYSQGLKRLNEDKLCCYSL